MDGEQLAPTKTILQEITERLAALTPEQFVPPPANDAEKDPAVGAVGKASEEVKRLYTLMGLIEVERYNRDKELDELERGLEADFPYDRLSDILEMARNGTPDERLDRIYALEEEQRRSAKLHAILSDLLEEQIRWEFPYLARKPNISILSDWSVGWINGRSGDVEEGAVTEVYDFGVVPFDFMFRRRR